MRNYPLSAAIAVLFLVSSACSSLSPMSPQCGLEKTSPKYKDAAYYSYWLDARSGPALNSGQKIPWHEKVRAHIPFIGFLVFPNHAVSAALGTTQTEYAFNRGEDGLLSRRDMGMAALLLRHGRITKDEFDDYLRYAFTASPGPDPAVLHFVKPGDELLQKQSAQWMAGWLLRWPDMAGPGVPESEMLLATGRLSSWDMKNLLACKFARDWKPPLPPNYYLLAEKYHVLSTYQVEQGLKRRFWTIYDWIMEARNSAMARGWMPEPGSQKKVPLELGIIELHLNPKRD